MKKYVTDVKDVQVKYAVTHIEPFGSVTFSNSNTVWFEEHPPSKGLDVVVYQLEEGDKGWRALQARYYQPYKYNLGSRLIPMSNTEAVMARIANHPWMEKPSYDWREFLKSPPKDQEQLLKFLVQGDHYTENKYRMMNIVMLPDFKLSPFEWKPWDDMNSFVEAGITLPIDILPSIPLKRIQKFLDIYYPYAKDQDLSPRILQTYNNYVLELLRILPLKDALPWVDMFELNDAEVWWNPVSASGYNPFGALIRDPYIEVPIKDMVDEEMREIVTSELAGKTSPRAEHEDALMCYAKHVLATLSQPWSDREPEEIDRILDQIGFILDSIPVKYPYTEKVFSDLDAVNAIFDITAEHGPSWIPQDLSRLLLETFFSIKHQPSLDTAMTMSAYLGNDPVYTDKLERMINEAKGELELLFNRVSNSKYKQQ